MLVLTLLAPASAADEIGRVEVHVVDRSGRPVHNARVCLDDRCERTDRAGVAAFDVAAGRHTAWVLERPARRHGGSSGRVEVDGGATAVRTLTVGPFVLPRGYKSPQPTVATVLERDELAGLPLQRSLAASLMLVPGIVSTRRGLSMGGAAPDEHTWLVDGRDVTDPVSGTWGPMPAVATLPPAFAPVLRR